MVRKTINVSAHTRQVRGKSVDVIAHQRNIMSRQRLPTNVRMLDAKIKRLGATDTLPFNKKAVSAFHLPIETAVVIPSTIAGDKPISKKEFQKRIKQSELELASMFGGFTKVDTVGGFTDSQGKLVTEAGAKITVFTDSQSLIKKKVAFRNWILRKQKQWGQESMAFESEGDLYFIEKK